MRTAAQRLTLVLRILLGSASFAGVLTSLILVRSGNAQSSAEAALSEPVDHPESPKSDAQPVADGATQVGGNEDYAPNIGNIDPEQPPDMDLETGTPLNVFLTPFRWGRLSLLSFTVYEGYNSNPEFQKIPVGAMLTSLSGLALYSTQFAGWGMNLQYRPFLWISSKQTFKDFAAASLDLRTGRPINGHWHWTAGDAFRYSPTHSTEQGIGFVANPSGGFSIGNAFLSSGRNVLINGIAGAITDRYSENSSLTFHANQDFTRLSSYLGGNQLSPNLPTQEAMTYSAGATWRDNLSLRDTLSIEYVYLLQTATGTSLADVNSNTASVGLSYKLEPSLGVSVSLGPAWSTYSGHENATSSSHTSATLHGSLALSKEFRSGGIVVDFSRSNSFSGIISNNFHNRYDLTAHREFNARFHCSATASYLQQQTWGARSTNGELASAEVRYFISPDWAVFTQARYLHITGNERIFAPEKSLIVGLRWSWVPEKP